MSTGGRAVSLTALLLLAACQPQARRLLLLDLTLADPVVLEATAEPWHEVGYTVEYRRFYPHLTRRDLTRYRVVLLLGGREPEAPSDALTAGDLAVLTEWVRDGGVVVLGYAGDGEGGFDRWVMNRWLASVGAGIVIGDDALRDASGWTGIPRVVPLPASALRSAGHEPFPFERNHELVTRRDDQVLARATVRSAPILAASRVGGGLVIALSRHALGALGAQYRPTTTLPIAVDQLDRTRRFLVALARWSRRPAQWVSIPPAKRRAPLVLGGGPLPVSLKPPRLEPPAGAGTLELPSPFSADARKRPGQVPQWVERQGMRILGARLAADRAARIPAKHSRALDSLISFLDVGAFNVLWGEANPQAITDSVFHDAFEREEVRTVWRQTIQRLQTSSIRWIPGIAHRDFHLALDTVGSGREGGKAWCALDPSFWQEELAPAYQALARLAREWPDLIPGIALELADEGRLGFDYCDATWRAGLDAMVADAALARSRAEQLATLPVEARYDSLLESGLLAAYYGALERLVSSHAAALRAEVRAIRSDLLFAVYCPRPPADWYTLGLLRGLSGRGGAQSAEAPLLLWTQELRPRDLLARYRMRGINAIHALALSPARLRPSDWPRLRRIAFAENDGFWIGPNEDVSQGGDSLGRFIRRLSKER